MNNKKKLFITIAIILFLIVSAVIVLIILKDDNKKKDNNIDKNPTEEIVIPDAPAENTENLTQKLEKVEILSINNDVIEFSEDVEVENGDKVAVWVYSEPKFLGYFEIMTNQNGTKTIKGLQDAMKKLEIESGEHKIAIVTEQGESIGYINVFVEENKLFEDKKAAVESKYTTKNITEEAEITYESETKKDANKKSGYKEVTQAGINGLKEITYKVTYDENGKEISKEKISEKIIKKAVNEIVVVGSADYNINTSKITSEFVGFMCTEAQTMVYDNVKVCDDTLPLLSFKGISIDKSTYYVISVDEVSITPIKLVDSGDKLKATYNGVSYYFESRAGSLEEKPLTEELCNQYNLKCGSW